MTQPPPSQLDPRTTSRSARENKALMLSSSTLTGDDVCNRRGENLGHIKDFVIDTGSGQIHYAVMSCGGFLGMGDRLFAIPWKELELDPEKRCFLLDVRAEWIQNAPGFDKDEWPDMTDQEWASNVASYYRNRDNGAAPRM